MTPIEEHVIAEATQQANGSWTFEGKDTHSWLGLAEQQRKAAQRLGPQYHEYANESYLIAGQLQAMDDQTDPLHHCPACGELHDGYTLCCRDSDTGCQHCPEDAETQGAHATHRANHYPYTGASPDAPSTGETP